MRLRAIGLMLLGALVAGGLRPTWGQETFKIGQIFDAHRVKLGGLERTVALRVFKMGPAGDEFFTYAQLVTLDGATSQARVIYEGPQVGTTDKEPYRFVQGPAGTERIDFVGDIDGDGATEVVSARMQSDVRPPTWRVYRWSGKAFTFVRSARLMGTPDAKTFSWSTRDITATLKMPWVSRVIRAAGSGQIEAEITSYDGQSTMKQGTAVLQAQGSAGYRVVRWIKPLTIMR